MLLIHGDCGSGKSRALHALGSAPPAEYRAVYVPVPTLDFAGLTRWCLDSLGAEAGEEPVAALREAVARGRLLVLVDDAQRLPLETALALRQFERDARGQLAVVAACGSEECRSSAVVALGEPAAVFALEPGFAHGPEEVAEDVRVALTAGALPRSAQARPQQVAAAPPEAPRAAAASARSLEQPLSAPPPAPALARAPVVKPPRSVPLGLAVALACAAFLIPVAFGAGYVLGRTPAVRELAVSSRPALPSVAAAPPPPDEREGEVANAAAQLAPPASAEAKVTQAQAPEPIVFETAAKPAATNAPSVAAHPTGSSAVVESWGAPALISVAPAGDAP